MLTADGCERRRRELLDREEHADLLVISQPHHIFYLSGFWPPVTELAGWGINFLLIERDGPTRLVADNWNEERAESAFVDARDVWTWYDSSSSPKDRYTAAAGALASTLEQHYRSGNSRAAGALRVAVEQSHLPTAAREAIGAPDAIDITPALLELRRAKHEDELACIRRAIRAAEAGHEAARRSIRPGVTELDIYADVQAAIVRAAGEPIVMLGDFAAGRRSESGGGPPTSNALSEGDMMIFDLFPLVGGYRADITNTLVAGEPATEQKDHVAALEAAMRAGEDRLRPGVTGAEVYEACRKALEEAGLAQHFPHHAGHGLGLGHPESPFLVPESEETLREGDVVTLEPGAYVPGFGGARIEHNYLITHDGFERLSNHAIGLS